MNLVAYLAGAGVLLVTLVVLMFLLDRRLARGVARSEDELLAAHTRTMDAIGVYRVFSDEKTGDRSAVTEIIPAIDDAACSDCGGSRCWVWRDGGHTRGCGNFPSRGNSYASIEDAIAHPGRHTVSETVRGWVGHDWTPLALEVRAVIAPTFWARRLPVLRGEVSGGVA